MMSFQTMKKSAFSLIFTLLLMTLLVIACGQQTPPVTTITGSTMGTGYTIALPHLPENYTPEKLKQEIDNILIIVNNRMSTYQKDSELSKINQNSSTDWISISPELSLVMTEAQRISQLSQGQYDITVGPLVNLWGFGPRDPMAEDRIPSAEEIQNIREFVGYEKLHLQTTPDLALKKDHPNMYIDLSSIAKGYGVDQVANYLEKIGITNYLVDIGGELRLKGKNSAGQYWRIAIEKPVANERAVQHVIYLSNHGLATSGDYRNYFEKDGVRYSHTIDPHTGKPITHNLVSVTVVADTSMTADGLATMFMVMGAEASLALAEREKIAVFLVVKEKNGEFVEKSSTEFATYLQVPKP
ncbi:membrane-associated lipoprotein involved in thiamine biosynthesis [Beggiatoa alba B18LD]|uniref:FAD:protein FMN transferase n=1 Tax=Beggiatoa alba B18LD TaxID=395493 RepID=I3CG31_9GAMM|nr:FAD:protein FMN transferase [Beggiatoa alba]EIJ42574.1 membrane-associated lipoprotein involved in thiamine biosynthesis [Beggiatoa alba B18LD]